MQYGVAVNVNEILFIPIRK